MKKILIPLTIALLIAIGIGAFIYNSPDHRISRSMNLAKSLFDEGQWEEAKVELNKIIEIDATNLDAHIMLADVYKNLNDTENQITVYEKIIEIAPDREETYLDYAEIYIAKEDWQKAREILQLGVDNTSGQKVKDQLVKIEKEIAKIEEKARLEAERKEKLEQRKNEFEKIKNIKIMGIAVEKYITSESDDLVQMLISQNGPWYQGSDNIYRNYSSWNYDPSNKNEYGLNLAVHKDTGFEFSLYDNYPCELSIDCTTNYWITLTFYNANKVDMYVEMPNEFKDYEYIKEHSASLEKNTFSDFKVKDMEKEGIEKFCGTFELNDIPGKRLSLNIYFCDGVFCGMGISIVR